MADEPANIKDKSQEVETKPAESVSLQAQESFSPIQDKAVDQARVDDTASAARSGDLNRLQGSINTAFQGVNGNEDKFSKFGQALGNELKKDGIEVETKGSDITLKKNGEALTIKNGFQLDFNGGVDYYSESSAANGKNPKDVAKGFANKDAAKANAPKSERQSPDGKGLRVGQDGSYSISETNDLGNQRTSKKAADGSRTESVSSETGTETSRFDKDGKLSQRRQENIDGSYKEETFNPDGSLKKSIDAGADGSRTETNYSETGTETSKFDKDGKLAQRRQEDGSGNYREENYDQDGSLKKFIDAGADGSRTETNYSETGFETSKYDKDGKLSQRRQDNLDGSYKDENYNPDGSLKKSSDGRADGSHTDTTYRPDARELAEYDKNGNLSKNTIIDQTRSFTSYPDGSFKSEHFNQDGSPKHTVESRGDGSSRVSEFSETSTSISERDKDGNVLQKRQENLDGSYTQQQYNSDGSLKSSNEGKADGSYSETTVSETGIEKSEYDKNGKLSLQRQENLDGSYKQQQYNSDGSVKGTKEGKADGSSIETTVSETGIERSEFDQNGKLAQRRQDNLDGSYKQEQFRPDGSLKNSVEGYADGSRSETSYAGNSSETTVYDSRGNAISNRTQDADGSYKQQKLNSDGSATITEGSADGRTETRISDAGVETTRYDGNGNVTQSKQENPDGSGHKQRLNPDGSVTVRYTQTNGDVKETTTHGNDVVTRTETSTPDGKIYKTELPEGKTIQEERKNNGEKNLQVTDDRSGEVIYSSHEKSDGSYNREFTDAYGTRHNVKGYADGSRLEKQASELGEETTAYDSKGNVTFNQQVNPDGSGYQQIQNPDGSVTVNTRDKNGKIEQSIIKPEEKAATEPTEPTNEQLQKTLFDKNASAQDKLLAARDLAHNGQHTIKGEDGKTYRINTESYGKREGVVVTVAGMPALRGIVDNSTNEVSRQKNSRGQEVDFAGSTASNKFKDDPVVNYKRDAVPEKRQKEAPAPEQRQKETLPESKTELPPPEQKKPEKGIPEGFELTAQVQHGRATSYGYPGDPTGGGAYGFRDNRKGGREHRLYSTQDVLNGKAPYASVALSKENIEKHWKGHNLKDAPVIVSPELDKKYADFLKQKGLEHFPLKAMDYGPGVKGNQIDVRTGNGREMHGPDGRPMHLSWRVYAKPRK